MARDYASEYAHRLKRGVMRGLSVSQARGHPRGHETSLRARPSTFTYDPVLEEGLKEVRAGRSVQRAARGVHVSQERLRRYLVDTGVMERQGSRWRSTPDQRLRDLPVYTRGAAKVITVTGYENAVTVGRYMAGVGFFLATNDPRALVPYVGAGVRDSNGRWIPFETNPRALYEITAGGPEPWERIYRIRA